MGQEDTEWGKLRKIPNPWTGRRLTCVSQPKAWNETSISFKFLTTWCHSAMLALSTKLSVSDSVLLVSAQQSRQIHSPPRHTVTPTGSELGPFPTAHQPPLWPQHQHPPLSVNVWVGVRMWACKTCPHIRNTQVFPKLEESVLLDRNQDDHHLIILLYLNISCNRAVCWYQKKKKLIRKNTQD